MAISLTVDQKARLNRMCPASALAGGLGTLIDTLDGNTDEANAAKIGTLASLTTTDKTDIVTAINEVIAALKAETDSASGADYVGATPIASIGTANTDTVQEILEAIATLVLAAMPLAGGTFSGDVTIADTKNLVLATGTGTKIGTGATQKLGFFNATPAVQQATQTALKADYVEGDLDTAAKIATQLNLVAAGHNSLLAKLKTLGLIASA